MAHGKVHDSFFLLNFLEIKRGKPFVDINNKMFDFISSDIFIHMIPLSLTRHTPHHIPLDVLILSLENKI